MSELINSTYSKAVVQPVNGEVFVVAWGRGQQMNELLLLSGPDYSLDTPKASLSWPSTGGFSSSPDIYFAGPYVLQLRQAADGQSSSLRRISAGQNKTLTVRWTANVDNVGPFWLFSPSGDKGIASYSTSDQLPFTASMSFLDITRGTFEWDWKTAWTYPFDLGVVGIVRNKSHSIPCGESRSSIGKQFYYNAYCYDPLKKALAFNFTLGTFEQRLGSVIGTYGQWLLVRDETSGDLLGYSPFLSAPFGKGNVKYETLHVWVHIYFFLSRSGIATA